MLAALTRLVTSRIGRWVVIALWLAVPAGIASVAPSLTDVSSSQQQDFLPSGAESTRALALEAEQFPSSGTPGILVYLNESGLTDEDLAEVHRMETWLAAPERVQVSSVLSAFSAPPNAPPLSSGDGTTTLLLFTLQDPGSVEALQDEIRAIRSEAGEGDGDLQIWLTGPAGILDDAVSVFQSIDLRITLITVVLVLVILLVIYRAPLLALLPLFSVGLAYMTAVGMVALLAQRAGLVVNAQATSIMVVLLFGAGTDYMLFISARLKEELRDGEPASAALVRTMSSVGPAILSSAATTILAMLALGLATLRSFQVLGPVLALGMVFAILGGLTFIPAALSLLGRKAYWPSRDRGPATESIRPGVWGSIAGAVARRPLFTVIASLLVLGVFSLGTLTIRPTFDLLASLPGETPSVQGFRALERVFPPGALSPTDAFMVVDGDVFADISSVSSLSEAWAALPGVERVTSPARPFGVALPGGVGAFQQAVAALPEAVRVAAESGEPATLAAALQQAGAGPETAETAAAYAAGLNHVSDNGSTARFEVVFGVDPSTGEAFDLIASMRNAAERVRDGDGRVLEVLVGGTTATQYDTRAATNRDILVIAPIVLGIIFLVLAILVRAIVAPLYLLGTVVLSFFASLGISVVIFQGILGHPGVGYSVPVYMFLFLVALGIDYNIYIISRVREEVRRHGLREGTLRAVSRTGGVITSAGVILAGTFTALMSLPLLDLFQLGFVVALGVLLDTFFVRGIIVPGFVLLLGKWNWWPNITLGAPVESPERIRAGV